VHPVDLEEVEDHVELQIEVEVQEILRQ